LLKVKVSSRAGTPQRKPEEPNLGKEEAQPPTDELMTVETSDGTLGDVNDDAADSGVNPRQIDLDQKMGSHLNKLDSLISKAENAQYSMQHQTKQMRKFLNK
jgi:hypothetical protein